jgi:hypothetical protein
MGAIEMSVMTRVEELAEAVRTLSEEDLAAFRAWFAEYDGEVWDRQIEEDSVAGRLDTLIEGRQAGFP